MQFAFKNQSYDFQEVHVNYHIQRALRADAADPSRSSHSRLRISGSRQPPRSGLARPEPNFLAKFIFELEPDTAPYDFFCTRYTDLQKIDFLKMYRSRFSKLKHAKESPRTRPNHTQKIPRIFQNRSKIGPISTYVDRFSYINLPWVL